MQLSCWVELGCAELNYGDGSGGGGSRRRPRRSGEWVQSQPRVRVVSLRRHGVRNVSLYCCHDFGFGLHCFAHCCCCCCLYNSKPLCTLPRYISCMYVYVSLLRFTNIPFFRCFFPLSTDLRQFPLFCITAKREVRKKVERKSVQNNGKNSAYFFTSFPVVLFAFLSYKTKWVWVECFLVYLCARLNVRLLSICMFFRIFVFQGSGVTCTLRLRREMRKNVTIFHSYVGS